MISQGIVRCQACIREGKPLNYEGEVTPIELCEELSTQDALNKYPQLDPDFKQEILEIQEAVRRGALVNDQVWVHRLLLEDGPSFEAEHMDVVHALPLGASAPSWYECANGHLYEHLVHVLVGENL